MQEKVNKITSLIEKFLEEERLSALEEKELNEWLAEAEHNNLFFQQITDKAVLKEKLKLYAGTDTAAIWKKTLDKMDGGKLIDLYPDRKVRSLPIGKIAAAAAVVLCISTAAWYFFSNNTSNGIAKTEATNSTENRIVPGSTKATLTLADGSSIALNDAADGALAEQGYMQLNKTNGQLTYNKKPNVEGSAAEQKLFNTVITPKGGEYKVTLPDGSKVWLNAASSLRFPIAFAGNERIVELTGEAYFEVNPQELHNTAGQQSSQGKIAKTPFIVKINTPGSDKNEVEVLGTHFNVMAYTDEGAIKTTLIEGKVRVTSGNNNQTIRPGEQARLQEGKISVQHVDADDIIGWTNGFINVSGPNIDYTMRQIARWYNVAVKYEGEKPEVSFEGKLPRGASIADVIKLLNANNVKAKLNEKERTIIVTS